MASVVGFFSAVCLVFSVGVFGLGLGDPELRLQPLPAWLVLMCLGAAGALVHQALVALERRTRTLIQVRYRPPERSIDSAT